jgi:hypothetical protein
MYERTRFGTTPHSQKVVQDSDAYFPSAEIVHQTSAGLRFLLASIAGRCLG